MKLKLFLLLIIYNLSFCIVATATIRYVSKTGTSTPPYTSWATASDSIQKCINICQSGDTVYVAKGVYKETVVMIPGLALIGSDWDSTVINTTGLLQPGYPAITFKDTCFIAGFKIVISGVDRIGSGIIVFSTINGGKGSIRKNKFEYGVFGISIGNHMISVLDNIFSYSDIAIGLNDINTSVIKDNLILATGTGIRSEIGATPSINNNIIKLKTSNAIGIDCSFSYGTRIKNNLIITNNSRRGIETYFGDSVLNNVVYGYFSSAGIYSYGRDYTVNNSIINSAIGYRKNSGSTGTPVFKHNNVWGNTHNYYNYLPDSTNISHDPMYVNPDSMDFHLQMYSPLIDSGHPGIFDLDGTRSDIGLFGGPYGEKYTYRDLAPKPPSNVTAVYENKSVKLKWRRNTEADFSHYRIYRDTVPHFTYDTTKIVGVTSDTSFSDNLPITSSAKNYYYLLTVLDNTNHQSAPSEEVHVMVTGMNEVPPRVVEEYKLLNNYPNPFNLSTIIPYRLKESGYVKLIIYNVMGEVVRVLVNEYQPNGYYEAEFNPNANERKMGEIGVEYPTGYNDDIASGLYIYSLNVRGDGDIPVFTSMGKMILLK